MNRVFSSCCLLLAACCLLAYGYPDTLWTGTYGGWANEVAYAVCETHDGNFVIAGLSVTFGSGPQDVYTVKVDANGDTLWTRFHGGVSYESAHGACETSDSCYVIAGYTESFGAGGKDIYLLKLDSDGVVQWTHTYGGPLQDCAYAVCETQDGGLAVVGYRDGPSGWVKGDLWILKMNASGDTAWTKTYGGVGQDYGISIQETSDNGFVMGGVNSSVSAGGKDVWLVKTDANGDTVWTQVYGGALEDVGYDAREVAGSGYIVTGYINGTGQWTAGDVWLLKTDLVGDTVWTRVYGGSGEDFGFNVFPTHDNGYIIGGTRATNDGDMWLLKTDASGDTVWTQNYGGAAHESCLGMVVTSDSGYVLAGHSSSFGAGGIDFYAVRTEPDMGVAEEKKTGVSKQQVWTTIISGPIKLPGDKDCILYDISGREVDVHYLSPGIYFVKIENKIVQKVIKIR
jgi:hypothetical protein